MASAGLPIDASEVVRANMLPGPSVLQQAAKMGYPSTVYTTPQIASVQVYQNPDEELVGALCGSILFSSILVGASSVACQRICRMSKAMAGWIVSDHHQAVCRSARCRFFLSPPPAFHRSKTGCFPLWLACSVLHRCDRLSKCRFPAAGPSYDILKVDLTGDMLGHGRFGKVSPFSWSTRISKLECDLYVRVAALQVYKGVLNRTCPVAVKVVDLCTAADRIRFHAVNARLSTLLQFNSYGEWVRGGAWGFHVQEVSIMQRLSDQPHIVKCYEYNPQPVSATSIPHKPMLVMELMEVCPSSIDNQVERDSKHCTNN